MVIRDARILRHMGDVGVAPALADLRLLLRQERAELLCEYLCLKLTAHHLHRARVQLLDRAVASGDDIFPDEQLIDAVADVGERQRTELLRIRLDIHKLFQMRTSYSTKSNSRSYMLTVSPSLMPASRSASITPVLISTRWKYCSDS